MFDEHQFDGIISNLLTMDKPMRANPNPQTVAKLLINDFQGLMNRYKIKSEQFFELAPPDIMAALICMYEDAIITRKQLLDLIGEKLRQAKEIKYGQNQSDNLCEAQTGQTSRTAELAN